MAKPKLEPVAGEREYRGLVIGRSYFFMTLTHYWCGRLEVVTPTELVIGDAAWIPDTGRMSEFLKTGNPAECEPAPDEVIIPRNGTAAIPWAHELPRAVK